MENALTYYTYNLHCEAVYLRLFSWLLHKLRGRLPVTNLSSENLPTFRLNAPVLIRAKGKRCEQTLLFIAMHYWGCITEDTCHWRSKIGEDCSPTLPLHHSSLATRDFQSSISVEVFLCGYYLAGPWQRTGAVGVGGPAHPDEILRGPLQLRWRNGSPCLLDCCDEETGREEQSLPTFDPQWCVSSI